MNAQATKKQDRISTSSRFPAGALALAVTVTVLTLKNGPLEGSTGKVLLLFKLTNALFPLPLIACTWKK